MLKYLANLLKVLWDFLKPAPKPEPPIIEPPKEMTNEEKFLKVCIDALDTDPTPQDEVPDEVSCANTFSTLLQSVFPNFKKYDSTKMLDGALFMDKNNFARENNPKKYLIVVSPSKTDSKGNIIVHGHIGYFITDERIASTTSYGPNKGKFVGNYSWNSWVEEFKNKRKLPIYLYSIKS